MFCKTCIILTLVFPWALVAGGCQRLDAPGGLLGVGLDGIAYFDFQSQRTTILVKGRTYGPVDLDETTGLLYFVADRLGHNLMSVDAAGHLENVYSAPRCQIDWITLGEDGRHVYALVVERINVAAPDPSGTYALFKEKVVQVDTTTREARDIPFPNQALYIPFYVRGPDQLLCAVILRSLHSDYVDVPGAASSSSQVADANSYIVLVNAETGEVTSRAKYGGGLVACLPGSDDVIVRRDGQYFRRDISGAVSSMERRIDVADLPGSAHQMCPISKEYLAVEQELTSPIRSLGTFVVNVETGVTKRISLDAMDHMTYVKVSPLELGWR